MKPTRCYAVLIKAENRLDLDGKTTFTFADGGPFIEIKKEDMLIDVSPCFAADDFTGRAFGEFCKSIDKHETGQC